MVKISPDLYIIVSDISPQEKCQEWGGGGEGSGTEGIIGSPIWYLGIQTYIKRLPILMILLVFILQKKLTLFFKINLVCIKGVGLLFLYSTI